MDKINNLKKQLLEALLDYYIDLHNKDIEELTNVYDNYNNVMKKLFKDKFWDVMEVPNSLKNCFSITDRFVIENVHLLTLRQIIDDKCEYNYGESYKISYYKNSNYISVIKL